MPVLTTLRKAFKVDAWATAAWLVCLLAGCLALTGAQWRTAGTFLSTSVVMALAVRGEFGPGTAKSRKWAAVAALAAGATFLVVACASAVTGDVFSAVTSALLGGFMAFSARAEWRKQSPGRPASS